MRLPTVVTSIWRGATRVATRDPLLTVLVVALLIVVLIVAVPRRSGYDNVDEDWESEGTSKKLDSAAKKRVREYCKRNSLTPTDELIKPHVYGAAYDDAVKKCNKAKEGVEQESKKRQEKGFDVSKCVHKKGACPYSQLARVYPCAHKDDKWQCCETDGKRCGHSKRTQEYKGTAEDTRPDGAGNKKLTIPRCGGCTYYTKTQKKDKPSEWVCMNGYKSTGLAGRTDVGEFERRQCASSGKCKTCAVNKAEEWKKAQADPQAAPQASALQPAPVDQQQQQQAQQQQEDGSSQEEEQSSNAWPGLAW